MAEFLMPSLGPDMEKGTLIEWLVKPGDAVKRGDIVAVVDTEKATLEVEIFVTGVVESLLVPPGEEVPVGTPLALIRAEGEPVGAAPTAAGPSRVEAAKPAEGPPPTPKPPETAASAGQEEHVRAAPSARKLARELGIDLTHVKGTGPSGAITRPDVEKAAAAAPRQATSKPAAVVAAQTVAPAPAPAAAPKGRATPEEAHAGMRRAIAAAMSHSKREIPHYYLGQQVCLLEATHWLAAENAKRGVADRILLAALLVKSVALAARDMPEFNGFWINGEFKPSDAVHVGVAISLRQGGLTAPAIHDADEKSLGEIMTSLADLVARARSGKLRSSEMSDPTITVTNLGDRGVESVFGVITPPQVALVGFGKPMERPWVIDGKVQPAPVIYASLSADHRVSDGHRGALFLDAIDRFLQQAEKL